MSLASQRRIHPRYPVHKFASYSYGGRRFLTLTEDLGLGGMKIDTSRHLPEGQYLNFKLVLGPDSIWLKGRIVYSKIHSDSRSLSGVQFVELSFEDNISLQKCIAFLKEWPEPRGMLSTRGRRAVEADAPKVAEG